jgi:pimeloyl-ACP methyl ester carboxylesterase
VPVDHSYGGMVITGVADQAPDTVGSLVYLDAFVPDDGTT